MTLVLQNKTNSKFLKNVAGAWTASREKALTFSNGLQAIFFCLSRRMSNMQIVVIFKDPKMNFAVPITDACGV